MVCVYKPDLYLSQPLSSNPFHSSSFSMPRQANVPPRSKVSKDVIRRLSDASSCRSSNSLIVSSISLFRCSGDILSHDASKSSIFCLHLRSLSLAVSLFAIVVAILSAVPEEGIVWAKHTFPVFFLAFWLYNLGIGKKHLFTLTTCIPSA